MVRLKFKTIKAALTSQYWLILTLSGAFFVFFALNRGGVVVFMDLSCLFLILNVLLGEYKLKRIPIFYWIAGTICAYLLLTTVLLYPRQSHYGWMANLVRMLGVVLAIHCLSQKKIASWVKQFSAVVLSASVCFQFGAIYFFNMPYGTFTNPHYIGTFVVLVLPVISFFFWTTRGWGKIIFVPVILMDAQILLKSGSRPAFIALITGIAFALIFLIEGRRKWIGAALVIFSILALYITDYAKMATRIEDLIVHLADEERVQLWAKAWNVLQGNSLKTWMFGHGIGWFSLDYTIDSKLINTQIFPHSYILEVLYSNGIIGTLLIFAALIYLLISSVITASHFWDKNNRILLKCIIVVYWIWFFDCGLIYPIYSKYSQYPLAFILGLLMVIITKNGNYSSNCDRPKLSE